jgi:diketogulonate reductase-like aldo/keto reductase
LTENSKKIKPVKKIFFFQTGLYEAEPGEDTVGSITYAVKEVGYRMLDSAQFYKNEEEVAKGVAASGVPREQIFVTTKLFTTKGGKAQATETVESSLSKMKSLGYIDQYLLHAPQGGAVLECYDVLLDYQKRGLIKTVGVSNFGVAHLEALKNSGRPLPQVNQIELHPWWQQEEIVAWCRANSVAVVGYSPLVRNQKKDAPVLVELAAKHGKSQAQILIRYSLQKGWITIPKSVKPERLVQNASVFDFELDAGDMAKLNEQGKEKKNVCWNPTVNDIPTEFGPTK